MDSDFQTIITHEKIGNINVAWNEARLLVTGININKEFENVAFCDEKNMEARFGELHSYLKKYGACENSEFPIECLDFSWAGEFYRKVYRALYKNVKKGTTVTYSQLAAMAGNPSAARAAGSAMRNNRFLVAIGCHRVVGKNYLGNFSAGIEIKKLLLEIDGL